MRRPDHFERDSGVVAQVQGGRRYSPHRVLETPKSAVSWCWGMSHSSDVDDTQESLTFMEPGTASTSSASSFPLLVWYASPPFRRR